MNMILRDGDQPDTGVVRVSAGLCVQEPFMLDDSCVYKKIYMTLERGAQMTVHEASAVEELTIVAHAHATCSVHVVITQACTKKITLVLEGEGAQIELSCLYALAGDDSARIHARQEHHAAATRSSMMLRGVLSGSACVEHTGMIFVSPQASRSSAAHNNKTILLSGTSRLDSSPDLEVLQQNVQCSHGTAVGPLDEEQLLYLRSRGLMLQGASRLLLEAFFNLSGTSELKKRELEGFYKKLQEMV